MSFRYFSDYPVLQKYWNPLLLIFTGYLILTLVICFWTNINNDLLKKKTGIIEDFKMNIVPCKGYMWYISNIKIKDDPMYYVQTWRVSNNIFLYYFLFKEKKFTKYDYFEPGRHVEFYIDKPPESYPYILTEKYQDIYGKTRFHSTETPVNVTTILSYGLKIDNKVIFDYKKRGFATPLFGRLLVGLLLLFLPLALMGVFFITETLKRLLFTYIDSLK